jgi:uncharacterized protein (TIGR02391 family)
MSQISSFKEEVLRAICNVLGDTHEGLTGSEIGKSLKDSRIDDPLPSYTKRDRLFEALNQKQKDDKCANNVVAFIQNVMNPVRYTKYRQVFDKRCSELNTILAFAEFALGDDGKLQYIDPVHTLSEAEKRKRKLYEQLLARNAHADILHFCRAELLQDNYFHAVFEATKSIADKIRSKSGLTTDGSKLVDEAFGGGTSSLLAFNSLQTETERSEHTGFMSLLKGLFSTFRNTMAHVPKIKWNINEQDALDILSFMSLLHRRLDECVRTKSNL